MSEHGGEGAAVEAGWVFRRRRLARPIPPAVALPWETAEGAAQLGEGGEVEIVRAVERPAEPTVAELAVNFSAATARWAMAGLPVVSKAVYAQRTAACGGCELWDGRARLGLGICRAPGCGCTRFKRWVATERCKHPRGSRWPV